MSASALPLSPVPLSAEQDDLLRRLTQDLDPQRLWWLSGYAAGLANARPGATTVAAAPAVAARPVPRLTIVYGSQTGNARREAEKLAAAAEGAGMGVRLLRADAYPQRELAQERLLYIVISTQGEGDPPDDAIGLVEFIAGKRVPRLPELRYAVLGLGDSSYADFCGIGRRLDARLAELGASRLLPPGEADVDVEAVAAPWRQSALEQARIQLKAAPQTATVTPLRPHAGTGAAWSHDKPFAAELLLNQRITGRKFKGVGYLSHGGVGKDVRHLELSLSGSGLQYEPGDALGVCPRNPGALVEPILAALSLDGESPVDDAGRARPLREVLAGHRELARLSRPLLAAHAARAGSPELDTILAGGPLLGELLGSHQPIDVLRRWPAAWDAQGLVDALRPLAPRLYSIASSRKRVGEEAHLTVDVLGYQAFGHAHAGAASAFLASLEEGAHAPVYLEPNDRFRVPADGSRDIIMVGPGTGVAPFRGFVQERAESGARGRNWLLFGARSFDTGFLYQSEWQDALRAGELHRLDVAFSRDQAERVHVQQRLVENAREVYAWLQSGAHFYICGALAMGRDVHAALLRIVAEQGAQDAESAAAYLTALQAEGRYSRDVY